MLDIKILVVDDNPTIGRLIERTFAGHGATVVSATSGKEGLRRFYELQPDLVILDLMMPGMDGFEVCRQIRMLSDVPIIMLSALSKDEQVAYGLSFGADDYVTKPFSPQVLLARAEAVLRRTERKTPQSPEKVYADGYLTIDLGRRRLTVDGQVIHLSPTEFRLLAELYRNAGQVLTYQQILEEVWGWEYRDQVNYVHVYVSRLRQKIEPDPDSPQYLLNEPRVGYRFDKRNTS